MPNIYFIQTQNGKGKSLFTVPGQKLTSRTPLQDDCMTHGCESVRKKYPVGTVFVTEASNVKFRNGCYHVLTLHPLLLPNGAPADEDNIFDRALVEEFNNLKKSQLQ